MYLHELFATCLIKCSLRPYSVMSGLSCYQKSDAVLGWALNSHRLPYQPFERAVLSKWTLYQLLWVRGNKEARYVFLEC